MSLIGKEKYSLVAYFEEYKNLREQVEITSTLTIVDPCLAPKEIQFTEQTSPSTPYNYTDEGLSFTLKPYTVFPPVCDITYKCVGVEGPDGDAPCEIPDVSSFTTNADGEF